MAIKNGQFRDTGNIGHKTQNENTTQTQKHNTDTKTQHRQLER